MRDESTQQLAQAFQDRMKWWLLGIIMISNFAVVFNLASLSPLQLQFQNELNIDEIGYSRLLQMLSLPGLIFPLFAGVIADYYGASLGVGAGLSLGLLGQLLITFGVFITSYWCVLGGFLIQNTGMHFNMLSKNKIIRTWFNDNEISRANSFIMISSTVSVLLCDIAYPNLYQTYNTLRVPYSVGSVISAISLAAGVVLILIHKKLQRLKKKDAGGSQARHLSLKSIKDLPKTYWLVTIAAIFGMNPYLNAKSYESKFLQTQFHFSVGTAGVLLSIGVVASGVTTPIGGILMDKIGRLPFFLMASVSMAAIGLFLNAIIPGCDQCFLPIVPLIIMSLGSGWVGIVGISTTMRLVQAKNMGVAVAIFFMMNSLAGLIIPTLTGEIAQRTYQEWGYKWVFIVDAGLLCIGLLVGVLVQIVDWRGARQLQYVMRPRQNSKVETPLLDPQREVTGGEETSSPDTTTVIATIVADRGDERPSVEY